MTTRREFLAACGSVGVLTHTVGAGSAITRSVATAAQPAKYACLERANTGIWYGFDVIARKWKKLMSGDMTTLDDDDFVFGSKDIGKRLPLTLQSNKHECVIERIVPHLYSHPDGTTTRLRWFTALSMKPFYIGELRILSKGWD